jgi:hypothetical protein
MSAAILERGSISWRAKWVKGSVPSRAAASDSNVGVGVEEPVLLAVLPPRVLLVTRPSTTCNTGETYTTNTGKFSNIWKFSKTGRFYGNLLFFKISKFNVLQNVQKTRWYLTCKIFHCLVLILNQLFTSETIVMRQKVLERTWQVHFPSYPYHGACKKYALMIVRFTIHIISTGIDF